MKKIELPRKTKKALIKVEDKMPYFMAIAVGKYEMEEMDIIRNPFYNVNAINMRNYIIDIEEKTVFLNGKRFSFEEAGLGSKGESSNVLENEDEIIEYLIQCHEIEYPNDSICIEFI